MFDNLIESKAKRQKNLGQTLLSVALHAIVIVGVVNAASVVAEEAANKPVDTTMVFLKPPPEAPPPPPPPPPEEQVVAANPPPKGFQTVVAPDQIPTEIPPINLNEKPFDPKDFTGKGVEGGIAAGVVGGSGPVDLNAEVFTSSELDDPAQAISQPQPRYPPALQAAGIAGSVTLLFIVDTTGHVEPQSIKVTNSTHKAFEEPARETILKSVFRPAKNRGTPVRQQVQQKLSFRVGG